MAEARKKILCIEDDGSVATMIAEELTDRGFEVVVAHDGHEGFVAILKLMPDLVLCDINLPLMSGFEVLERLNALAPRLGRILFVFLTALSDRDSELRARRLGADDYVTKPIDFDMLGMIINARLADLPGHREGALVFPLKKARKSPGAATRREAAITAAMGTLTEP